MIRHNARHLPLGSTRVDTAASSRTCGPEQDLDLRQNATPGKMLNRISVVLLLYTWKSFLEEQLQSLRILQSHRASPQCPDFELIVVDNGSLPSDSLKIAEHISSIGLEVSKFISLSPGRGFGGGMNAGIAESSGDLVIALNSDCILGAGLIEALGRLPLADDIGFVAPAVYDWVFRAAPRISERTERMQGLTTVLTFHGSCTPGPPRLRPGYVLGPMGPCIVLTRTVIAALTARTGCIFDDTYFSLYGEDCELYLAARSLGFKTIGLPPDLPRGIACWHIGSATTNGGVKGTITFPPALAATAIRSFLGNCFFYSGWLELPVSLPVCLACHGAFVVSYTLRNGARAALQLVVRLLAERRTRRRALRRPLGCRFLPQAAVLAFRVVPWARIPC